MPSEPVILSLNGDGEYVLLCPVCGHDCSHIDSAFTRQGSDPFENGPYDGTEVRESSGWRRSALVIRIEGECFHNWNIVIQQHKGKNLVSVEILPESDG